MNTTKEIIDDLNIEPFFQLTQELEHILDNSAIFS